MVEETASLQEGKQEGREAGRQGGREGGREAGREGYDNETKTEICDVTHRTKRKFHNIYRSAELV